MTTETAPAFDARRWADHFLIDPTVTFLNHGSFGGCPRPVFAAYQRLQAEMERQPVEWLGRRAGELLAHARGRLGAFVGADPDDLVFVPNPTTAVNIVARSLHLGSGDEILTTDHEYGAMNRTWNWICSRSGASLVRAAIPVPVSTHDEVVERVWAGVSERTRVLFISHLTSETALILPVRELCRRARAAGILSIVDGAHVPAHLDLDLRELDADIYTGACHKWLCAPKGSAFLWVRPDVQPRIEPLVVSWGWEADDPGPSPFVDHLEWQGTRDLSAFLATSAAIDHYDQHDWPVVSERCRRLAVSAQDRFHGLVDQQPLSPIPTGDPASPRWFGQMVAIRLPDHVDVADLKRRLYDDWRVEVPVYRWNGVPILRISVQAYNDEQDLDRLHDALVALLPSTSPIAGSER